LDSWSFLCRSDLKLCDLASGVTKGLSRRGVSSLDKGPTNRHSSMR